MSVHLPGDYFVLSTSLGSTAKVQKQRQGLAPSFVLSRSDRGGGGAHWPFHSLRAQRLPRSLVPAQGSFPHLPTELNSSCLRGFPSSACVESRRCKLSLSALPGPKVLPVGRPLIQ